MSESKIRFLFRLLLLFGCLALTTAYTSAQTFNVPSDPAISVVSSGMTLNLSDGGTLFRNTTVTSGGVLNLLGGNARTPIIEDGGFVFQSGGIADAIVLNDGAFANISGGFVENQMTVQNGAEALVVGGSLSSIYMYGGDTVIKGGAFNSLNTIGDSGARVDLYGYDFRLNGTLISDLSATGDSAQIDLSSNEPILTGYLQNGQPFALAQGSYIGGSNTSINPGLLTLHQTESIVNNTETINLADDPLIAFIGDNQTLRVVEGDRTIERFRAGNGSHLIAEGGYMDDDLFASNSTIDLKGDVYSRELAAFNNTRITIQDSARLVGINNLFDSQINVEGGETAEIRLYGTESMAKVSGGTVYRIYNFDGGTYLQTGGYVQDVDLHGAQNRLEGGQVAAFRITSDAEATISGGRISHRLDITPAGLLKLEGGEFRLDGNPVEAGTTLAMNQNSVLTGVYSNGVPFAWIANEYLDDLEGQIELVAAPVPAIGPDVINVSTDLAPEGIREGQTLTVNEGGFLPAGFVAGKDSHVIVNGGTVGNRFRTFGSTVDITGGVIGQGFVIKQGTVATVSGAAKLNWTHVYDNSTLTFNGASASGAWVDAMPGSKVNVHDGNVESQIRTDQAQVHVTGGQVDSIFLNLASNAVIDGGELGGISVLNSSSLTVNQGSVDAIRLSGNDTARESEPPPSAVINNGQIGRVSQLDVGLLEIQNGNIDALNVSDGVTNLRGGALGDAQNWLEGELNIHGYDFQIDGVPISNLENIGDSTSLSIGEESLFTGVLADGTPFIIEDDFQRNIYDGVVTLHQANRQTEESINVVDSNAPRGVVGPVVMTLSANAQLEHNFVAGANSTVIIDQGVIGKNFEMNRSTVTFYEGAIGTDADVFAGAVLNIAGGVVDNNLEVHSGGIVNLSSGTIRYGSKINQGGLLSFTGGEILGSVTLKNDATINIQNGYLRDDIITESGALIELQGGIIDSVQLASGSTLDISDGALESSGRAKSGSIIRQTGGSLGDFFRVEANVDFSSSGGSLGRGFTLLGESEIKLEVHEAYLDGVLVEGLSNIGDSKSLMVPQDGVLTGVLADGTPFLLGKTIFGSENISAGTFSFTRSNKAAITNDEIINTDRRFKNGFHGVANGRTVRILEGGILPKNFLAIDDSNVILDGGKIEGDIRVTNAKFTLNDGEIDSLYDLDHIEVEINGGRVDGILSIESDSSLLMTGGLVDRLSVGAEATAAVEGGEIVYAAFSSTANHILRGGVIYDLSVTHGSSLEWRGGLVDDLYIFDDALTIYGYGLQLNGESLFQETTPGLEGSLVVAEDNIRQVYTGFLEDGTPFAMANDHANAIDGKNISFVQTSPAADPTPFNEVLSNANSPDWIGKQQNLRVIDGGILGQSFAVGNGAKLVIDGGIVEDGLHAVNGHIKIIDGTTNGSIEGFQGSLMEIEGGNINGVISLLDQAELIISGGDFNNLISAESGASIEIIGTKFWYNGTQIRSLDSPGDSLLFRGRGRLLEAELLDGSRIAYDLNPSYDTRGFRSHISYNARLVLTVGAVPEPSTLGLLFLASTFNWRRRQRN